MDELQDQQCQEVLDDIKSCPDSVYYRIVVLPRGGTDVVECREVERDRRDATHDMFGHDFGSESAAYEWIGRFYCVASRMNS